GLPFGAGPARSRYPPRSHPLSGLRAQRRSNRAPGARLPRPRRSARVRPPRRSPLHPAHDRPLAAPLRERGQALGRDRRGADMSEDLYAEERAAILKAALVEADFGGWSLETLRVAADKAGVDRDRQRLAFPRGVLDLLEFYSKTADDAMADQL